MSNTRQGGGRPRDGRVDHAIAAGVRTLLAELGYTALTVDAVAARAGVGKAAIYRRYASKQEMIFGVLLHDLRIRPPADTGSLRGDITALTAQFGDQLADVTAEVLAGLLADIHADAALGTLFTERYLTAERSLVTTLLDRAVTRGELAHRPDPAIVHALLLGPLFAWQIMLDEDPTHTPPLAGAVARIVADALVSGVLSPSTATAVHDVD